MVIGGNRSNSGEVISAASVWHHPVVFRGVSMVSSDVAKMPVAVYRKDANGNREKDLKHEVSQLLRKRVNPSMHSHRFIKTIVGHAMLFRGGYAMITRDRAGRVLRLTLLNPQETYPVKVTDRDEVYYQTVIGGNPNAILRSEDVFHICGLGHTGVDGHSFTDKLRDALGLGLAAQKHGAVYFKNSAIPSMMIEFPDWLPDEQAVERFKKGFENMHGGDNSHGVGVIENGGTVKPLTIDNQASQFLELREFDVKVIASALGIPPSKFGAADSVSYNSLEQENQSYLDQAVDPWAKEFEVEANDKLLQDGEHLNDESFVEFERKALIRTNTADRFAAYNTGIMSGFMSRGDARRAENMPNEDGLDDFLVPLNMGVLQDGEVIAPGKEDPEPAPEVDEDSPEDAARQLEAVVQDISARMIARLCKDAQRAAGKPDKFLQWIDEFRDRHDEVLVSNFTPVRGEERARHVVADLLLSIHGDMNDLADRVPPKNLAEAVRQYTNAYQNDLPQKIAASILGGDHD